MKIETKTVIDGNVVEVVLTTKSLTFYAVQGWEDKHYADIDCDSGFHYMANGTHVTHWIPLPEPPTS